MAIRIHTIVSEPEILEQRFQELKILLEKQNYPKTLKVAGIDKARPIGIREARTVNPKVDDEIIAYVSTFNPRNTGMYGQIRDSVRILKRDSHMKDLLGRYKTFKNKRQENNSKKLLTRARFSEKEEIPKVFRCNRPNCGLCRHLLEGDRFIFKCGRVFKVKSDTSCDIKNVIYVIKCCGSDKEYIGETGDLRKRVTIHSYQIWDTRLAFRKYTR